MRSSACIRGRVDQYGRMSSTRPRLAIVTPPVLKPCEPGLSGAAAAAALRSLGVDAAWLDGALGWFRHTTSPANLGRCLEAADAAGLPDGVRLAFRRGARHVEGGAPAFGHADLYRHRKRYSSAVSHLENALRLASVPFPGLSLRVGDVEIKGRRALSAEHLEEFSDQIGPFDAWADDVLLPWLDAGGFTHVGLSLTFTQQAWATFRLATLLGERRPGLTRVLAGPLVSCWSAVGVDLSRPPFDRFDRVLPSGDEAELTAFAVSLGGGGALPQRPWAVDLDEADWSHYLAPVPIVPAAIGRGCYWRACTFCPDHLHDRYRPCGRDALSDWLHAVAARFPDGAMLHLTDSALVPAHLERLADVIARDRLPLRWHGFVRFEPRLAEPGFARHLAEGGCSMLQLGLETASPRLLDLMDKGQTPELERAVLRATAAAGISNHAYLLFGLPTETDAEREQTLAFVEAEAAHLHDLNVALLNLPRQSPMHREPARFGITSITSFGPETDLSLYDDFRCGASHPRVEARRWLDRRFYKSPAVRRVLADLRNPFAANHGCFLGAAG